MLVVICLGFVVAGTLLVLDLHRFFIAISRAVVIHDGRDGSTPDPIVWSAGTPPIRRRLVHCGSGQSFLAWAAWYWGFGVD